MHIHVLLLHSRLFQHFFLTAAGDTAQIPYYTIEVWEWYGVLGQWDSDSNYKGVYSSPLNSRMGIFSLLLL